jgi:hypothetical protein
VLSTPWPDGRGIVWYTFKDRDLMLCRWEHKCTICISQLASKSVYVSTYWCWDM